MSKCVCVWVTLLEQVPVLVGYQQRQMVQVRRASVVLLFRDACLARKKGL